MSYQCQSMRNGIFNGYCDEDGNAYDPNSDMYDPTGYSAFQGSSYAAPLVAGTVALVKQNHSAWTPAQLKSAVVNTATQDVTDGGVTARVNAVGAGKLNVGDAVNVAATLDPATISFGAIGAGALPSRRPHATRPSPSISAARKQCAPCPFQLGVSSVLNQRQSSRSFP